LHLPQVIFKAHIVTEGEIDEETLQWPYPLDHLETHNLLIHSHQFLPLPIYESNNFVECSEANALLLGALVEVHFVLKHFHIKKEGYDSFLAVPLQVLVLKQATKISVHHDVRAGPVLLLSIDALGTKEG
jgi:hypothetical protein